MDIFSLKFFCFFSINIDKFEGICWAKKLENLIQGFRYIVTIAIEKYYKIYILYYID